MEDLVTNNATMHWLRSLWRYWLSIYKSKKWKMKKGQSDVANVFNIVRFIDSSILYYVNNFIFFCDKIIDKNWLT